MCMILYKPQHASTQTHELEVKTQQTGHIRKARVSPRARKWYWRIFVRQTTDRQMVVIGCEIYKKIWCHVNRKMMSRSRWCRCRDRFVLSTFSGGFFSHGCVICMHGGYWDLNRRIASIGKIFTRGLSASSTSWCHQFIVQWGGGCHRANSET